MLISRIKQDEARQLFAELDKEIFILVKNIEGEPQLEIRYDFGKENSALNRYEMIKKRHGV